MIILKISDRSEQTRLIGRSVVAVVVVVVVVVVVMMVVVVVVVAAVVIVEERSRNSKSFILSLNIIRNCTPPSNIINHCFVLLKSKALFKN